MNFVTSLLSLFQPAPYIDEINDPEKIKKEYRYWRIRILYSMFIGYALYYFTRKSFIIAMPGLLQDGVLKDKADLGLLVSIFSIAYGGSKFISGILSDRSNPRYFMAIGLIITGLLNVFFGFSSSLWFFAIFWGLNGWFQGFGWPPCARFLTHWYSQSERGAWWSTFNVSHNVGAFAISWFAGACLQFWGWRSAMYLPGIICIFGGFYLINRLRDTPQSLGLPTIEKFRNDYTGSSKSFENERELTGREILLEYVIKNKYIWLLSIAYFFIYMVRTGIVDWTALYLIEEKGYSNIGANGTVSFFEIGGFFGNLIAGWSSDKLFDAKRGPVNVLFSIGMFLSILFFWFIPAHDPITVSVMMFLIGVVTWGPQMMIGMAAAELSHKKAAATATGFAGWFAYLGAATAGYPLGMIAQNLGWFGFFLAMCACCLIAALLLIPMWNIKENKKATKKASIPAT